MTDKHTLAKPYARAAFEFASTANKVDKWITMLELACNTISQPKVSQGLGNPTLMRKKKASYLLNLLIDEVDEAFSNFIQILGEHDRLTLLPMIYELYYRHKLEADNVIDVTVETAYELKDEQFQNVVAVLTKRFGRAIQAKQEINAALIGGLIIHAGDLVIDSSIRGRLDKLAEAMNS